MDHLSLAERMGDLIQGTGKTLKEIGAETGLTSSTLSCYQTGKRVPNSEHLTILCRYFGVSSDWLLGLSDFRNKQTEGETIGSLGLSEAAVERIRYLQQSPACMQMLNDFLASAYLPELMKSLVHYRRASFAMQLHSGRILDGGRIKTEALDRIALYYLDLLQNEKAMYAPTTDRLLSENYHISAISVTYQRLQELLEAMAKEMVEADRKQVSSLIEDAPEQED